MEDFGSTGGENTLKPLYDAAAQRFRREGEDPDSFLARNTDSIGNSPFPGPDCLHPDELCKYRRTGSLPGSRSSHVLTCVACSAMVDATRPSPDRVRAFRAAVIEEAGLNRSREAVHELLLPNAPVSAVAGAKRWTLIAAMLGTLTVGSFAVMTISKSRPLATTVAPPQILVTAHLSSSKPSENASVRTQPITVTASANEVATTVAATAAVLTHLRSEDLAAQAHSPSSALWKPAACSSSSPTCQELVSSYANVLSDYLQDEKSKPVPSLDQWFEDYKKTHPAEVLTLEAASKNSNVSVSDESLSPIVPTLKTASAYYVTTSEKFDTAQTMLKPIDVKWMLEPHVMLTVKVSSSERSGEKAGVR